MKSHSQQDRRNFMSLAAKSTAFAAMAASMQRRLYAEDQAGGGGIKHSVCKWCYRQNSIEEIAIAGKAFGLSSIELLDPDQIKSAQSHGLTCALVNAPTGKTDKGVQVGGIPKAFNRKEYHDTLVEIYTKRIEQTAALGLTNLICFSGNRDGMDDEEGLQNCAQGIKRLLPVAEKHNVTITLELLNSLVNHKDYMGDTTKWGTRLVDTIGSDNFKLLYDIYHMQIMEGNVIKTIQDNHQYFSHYHTGGVPGRNEIDDTQELNYPAIVKAIADTGYKGFIGQEFIPAREDKLASLKQGVEICTLG
jgi:hydroxypyruvate isomerase